jgi:hypothetical protein
MERHREEAYTDVVAALITRAWMHGTDVYAEE